MDDGYVAMERNVCPVCGNTFDTGAILIDRHLGNIPYEATITGMSPCPECQALSDQGYVALVGVDPARSNATGDKLTAKSAYRTGGVVHMRRAAAARLFDKTIPNDLLMVFVDQGVLDLLEKTLAR